MNDASANADTRSAKMSNLFHRLEERNGEAEAQREMQRKLQLKLWLTALKSRTTNKNGPIVMPTTSKRTTEDNPSAASLTVEDDVVLTAQNVRRHGVSMLRSKTTQVTREHLDLALIRLERLREEVARQDLEEDGLKTKEIVSRNHGRFDIIFDDAILGELGQCGFWLPVVRATLGAASYLLKSGAVIALPGALIQKVHQDGKHLFHDEATELTPLPPHCLTVFIPLCDLSADLGPTEFYPDTHSGQYPQLTSDALSGRAETQTGITFDQAKAFHDAIIFDYRIVHRGLANTSSKPRPLLYFTYAKPWFRDATNYSNLSLFASSTS